MRKFKFIQVELKKEYVLAFRLVMILAAWPFLSNIYDSFATGEVSIGTFTAVKGVSAGFYFGLAKNFAFALLFVWLASLGVTAKAERNDNETTNREET